MPFNVFVFLLSIIYIYLLCYYCNNFWNNISRFIYVVYISKNCQINLPIIVAIIHSAPILSIILIYLTYKEKLDYRAIMGIIIAITYSNNKN
jgi:hypothetical protein